MLFVLGATGRMPRLGQMFPGKRALLLEQSLSIDCVFVGSSRYYRHIDPPLVDQGWTFGRSGTSFNLGIPALTMIEQQAVLESPELRMLPRLRVVVIEPILSASLDATNLTTTRSVAEHSPSGTWALLNHLMASDLHTRRRLWYGGLHLAGLGLHLFWIPGLETLAAPKPESYLPAFRAGFLPSGDGGTHQNRDVNETRLQPEIFAAAVAASEPFRQDGRSLPQAHLEEVIKMAAYVRQIGARPVLLITPRLHWDVRDGRAALDWSTLHAFRRSLGKVDLPLLSYYDRADFLRAELWYDPTHMNERGAQLFSRQLGQDLNQLAQTW